MNSDKEALRGAIEHAREKGQENTLCGEEHRQLAAWLEELEALRVERSSRNSAADEAFGAIAALCECPHWEYPGQIVRDVTALVESKKKTEEREAELKLALDDLYNAVIHEVPEENRNDALNEALKYVERVEEGNPVLDNMRARLIAAEEKSSFYMKDWYEEKHKFGTRIKEEVNKRKEAERLFSDAGDVLLGIAESLDRVGDCFSTFPEVVGELVEENKRLKSGEKKST